MLIKLLIYAKHSFMNCICWKIKNKIKVAVVWNVDGMKFSLKFISIALIENVGEWKESNFSFQLLLRFIEFEALNNNFQFRRPQHSRKFQII